MYSKCPCEQKPLNYLGEKGSWAHAGTAQIFGVPPIIPGTRKATIFKFYTHRSEEKLRARPLKISGKVAVE